MFSNRNRMKGIIVFLLTLFVSAPCIQAAHLPNALSSYGVRNVYYGCSQSVKRSAMIDVWHCCDRDGCHIGDDRQNLPLSFFITGGKYVIQAKHTYRQRLSIAFSSSVILTETVNRLELSTQMVCPNAFFRSTCSLIHTATVFCGAELIREEYGNIYGLMAYVKAASVALSRLYDNRYWLNDVIAGAEIGILSARSGMWIHDKWL